MGKSLKTQKATFKLTFKALSNLYIIQDGLVTTDQGANYIHIIGILDFEFYKKKYWISIKILSPKILEFHRSPVF